MQCVLLIENRNYNKSLKLTIMKRSEVIIAESIYILSFVGMIVLSVIFGL